jgi:4-amino-4-deoxy-L-arabinose transferase-like glycosyltransferase
VTVLRLVLAALLPLTPQEAYYWMWSREFAASYFDHPPLASWTIALTTAVVGATVFGVKLAAVLWGLVANVLWARLIADLGADRRVQFWALAAINLVGIVAAYGVVIAPDAPLLACWVGVLWTVWRASATGRWQWWLLAGFFLGLALTAKYAAVLLVPAIGLFLLASPRQRRWLLQPAPYAALALAAVVFSPVVLWNAQHDWASFAFQSTQRAAGMGRWRPQYSLQMIGTQLAVATPYLFVLALAAWWRQVRGWRTLTEDDGRLLLMCAATVPLVVFTLASLRSMVKPNWLAPVYAPLIVLAVQALLAPGAALPRHFKVGLATSAAVILAAGLALAWPGVPLGDGNTWSGWPEAARRIDALQKELAAHGERSFVFSTNYKNSALLAFHRAGHPRTYAQDVFGARALQFDYWPPEALAGATGIFVLDDRKDDSTLPPTLSAFFDDVRKVDTIAVSQGGRTVRRIDIYKATDYRGHPRANGR